MNAASGVVTMVVEGALELLFPTSALCPLCQRTGRGPRRRGGICPTCWLRFAPPMADVCDRCGRPQGGSRAAPGVCADCRRDPPPYLACRAGGAYDGPLKDAIGRMKYAGERALAGPLGCLIALRVQKLLADRRGRLMDDALGAGPPVLVPIPLHATRWRERGYNQAEDLTRSAARILRLSVRPHGLRRNRDALPQTGLSRRQRLVQPAGTFSAERWEGGPAIVIDDVTTTGATLREAARALCDAGAPAVFAATAAAVEFH